MDAICRQCGTSLRQCPCNLEILRLANSYLTADEFDRQEVFYPHIVQRESSGRIFTDYVHFSSYSQSRPYHARVYVHNIIARCRLDHTSKVIEIAHHDGYLPQYGLGRSSAHCLSCASERREMITGIRRDDPSFAKSTNRGRDALPTV
jgi:hypothetical protein